jgi:hypothetical protein
MFFVGLAVPRRIRRPWTGRKQNDIQRPDPHCHENPEYQVGSSSEPQSRSFCADLFKSLIQIQFNFAARRMNAAYGTLPFTHELIFPNPYFFQAKVHFS